MNRPRLSLVILALALTPACQVSNFQVTPSRTWTGLEGNVAATDLDEEGSLRGSTIDDLGVGRRQSNERIGLQWEGDGASWELFGHALDSRGTGALADDLNLEGVELRFDEGDVQTDLHLGLYGLRWTKPIAQDGDLKISAGASLLVAELDLDLDQVVLDADTGEPTGEEKSTGKSAVMPFPLPTLDLLYDHESFDFNMSLSGLWVWVDEGSGHIIDVDFHLAFPMFDDVGELVLGFQGLEMELDSRSGSERARLDVTFSGPYLGLQFGF